MNVILKMAVFRVPCQLLEPSMDAFYEPLSDCCILEWIGHTGVIEHRVLYQAFCYANRQHQLLFVNKECAEGRSVTRLGSV
jgi:hypothetical protein